MTERLTTGPFNGGYEFDYHDEHDTRCYVHLYDDGLLCLQVSRDGVGYGISLPPAATSVLRDYLNHVMPETIGREKSAPPAPTPDHERTPAPDDRA